MISTKQIRSLHITNDDSWPTMLNVTVPYLGKGQFCTAYGDPKNGVYLFCKEGDYSKEILTLADPDHHKHIPPVEYLGEDRSYRRVYRMPYYETISASHSYPWEIMKELFQTRENVIYDYSVKSHEDGNRGILYPYGNDIAVTTIDRARIPDDVRASLSNLCDAMGNYGIEWTFEFSKRNIGIYTNGNIIFRDVCFNLKTAYEAFKKRIK